jgi:hypothetical protein
MPRAKVCGRHRNKAVWDVIAKPTFFVCKAQLERHIFLFWCIVIPVKSPVSNHSLLPMTFLLVRSFSLRLHSTLYLSGLAGPDKKVTRPLSAASRPNDFFFLLDRDGAPPTYYPPNRLLHRRCATPTSKICPARRAMKKVTLLLARVSQTAHKPYYSQP